jgi:predicted GIY-YIG superfamily endonuclease
MSQYADLPIPLNDGHYVYRAWAGDTCVYVGVTGHLLRRIYEHKIGRGGSQSARMKVVFAQVTHVDFTVFDDRESAEAEEGRQIRLLQPEGNKHRRPLPVRRHYRAAAQGSLL